MHVIIDGYNLIRHSEVLRRIEKQSLEAGRRALAHRVALYTTRKDHRATIVFDGKGGISPDEEKDLLDGIATIFSRRGETADEVIKRMIGTVDRETVVVTSDRELADHATRHGVAAISSEEFEARIEMSRRLSPSAEVREDESFEGESSKGTKKKGAARRLSKREKTSMRRISKL